MRALMIAGIMVLFGTLAGVQAAPIYTAGSGTGVTTDILDIAQGAQVVRGTNFIGGFPLQCIFGGSGTGEDGKTAIFNDGNGGNGFVDFVEVRTPAPVTLNSYNLLLAQDAVNNPARSVSRARLLAGNDGITYSTVISDTSPTVITPYFSTVGSATMQISDSFPSVTAQYFRLELTRQSVQSFGPRVKELDGFGASAFGLPYVIDRNLMNANTNSGADQPAGLVNAASIIVSSRVLGTDTPADAFGHLGAVEPDTFIFGDGGTADNGDLVIGNAGETVSTMEWTTLSPATLAGYEINLSSDSGGTSRGAALVRLSMGLGGGPLQVVDLFSNGSGTSYAASGAVDRIFSGGPLTGDHFRLEFTQTSTNGLRLVEFDAIEMTPEPASLVLLGAGLLALARRRSRGRSATGGCR